LLYCFLKFDPNVCKKTSTKRYQAIEGDSELNERETHTHTHTHTYKEDDLSPLDSLTLNSCQADHRNRNYTDTFKEE